MFPFLSTSGPLFFLCTDGVADEQKLPFQTCKYMIPHTANDIETLNFSLCLLWSKIRLHHSWITVMGKDSERLFSNHMCQGRFLSGRKCGVKRKAEVGINEVRQDLMDSRGGWLTTNWERDTPVVSCCVSLRDNGGQPQLLGVIREI